VPLSLSALVWYLPLDVTLERVCPASLPCDW
jgi:hypothetical protein